MTRILSTLLLCFPLSLPAATLVIQPVNVIDVRTGNVLENQSVEINDGRIRRISPASGTSPGVAEVVDGKGGWLIPGLAEMHAHVPSTDRGKQYARDILTLFLANGVMTIRGMLGQPWHLELRESLASGAWTGPQLITSGPSFNGNTVSSPEQASRRVRGQFAAGYDFLKIHPGLNPVQFQAIARTATELGIPFAGHVSFEVGLEAALAAHQATIDHLDSYAEAMVPADSEMAGVAPSFFGLNLALAMDAGLAPELARATAQADVWVVPTQSLFETTTGNMTISQLMARPGMEYLSGDQAEVWKSAVENIRATSEPEQREAFLVARRALIGSLQEAGAGILLGSDAPQIMNVPGFSVHQEMAYMVKAGLNPLQALQSGTMNPARFFKFMDQGTIEEGKTANLVLLQANPLDDIHNTTTILGVMFNGHWYPRETLDRMLAGVKSRGI